MGNQGKRRSNWVALMMLWPLPFWFETTASAEGCPCATDGTSSLAIHTSVSMACTILTTAVAFGTYDPITANSTSPLDGTGGLTLNCTDGYNATITLGQGMNPLGSSTDAEPLRQMSDGGANRLQYVLYQDAARTTVWGNTFETAVCASGNIPVYGRIAGGQNVPMGEYLDVVVVTVNI